MRAAPGATWSLGPQPLPLMPAPGTRPAACAAGRRECRVSAAPARWRHRGPPRCGQDLVVGLRDQADPFFSLTEAHLDRGRESVRLSVPATTAPVQLPGRQSSSGTVPSAVAHARRSPRGGGRAERAGGHGRCPGRRQIRRRFTPLSDVLMRIHRGLKQAFDRPVFSIAGVCTPSCDFTMQTHLSSEFQGHCGR